MRLYAKTWRDLPLEKIVAAQHKVALEIEVLWSKRAVRRARAAHLCCFLVRRDLAQRPNGRVPWEHALPTKHKMASFMNSPPILLPPVTKGSCFS